MDKKNFKLLISKIISTSSIEELEKIVSEENLLDKIVLKEIDEEKAELLLLSISSVGNKFSDSFELSCPSMYGGTNLLGLSYHDKKPKVYMGYRWEIHRSNNHGSHCKREQEFLYISELNQDNETFCRYSYTPEYFEGNFGQGTVKRTKEMYQQAVDLLYSDLTDIYQEKQKPKVLSKSYKI